MSTEARDDGQPDAAGAVKPDAEANPEPGATAVAERGAAEPPVADLAVADLVVPEAPAARGTAWDMGEATAWAVAAPTGTEASEALPADGDADTGEASETVETAETNGDGETVEAVEADGAPEADEASWGEGSAGDNDLDEVNEQAEDAGESGDDEVSGSDAEPEGDEALEDDQDYGSYESGDAGPQRIRRWPRVLLALGFVVLAAVIVGGAIAIVGSVTHGFKKPVKITYKTSAVFGLKTGNCFDPIGAQSYTLISCDSPHQAEVFATFALTGTGWPGDAAVRAQASGGCASRLTGYVNPQLAISLTSTYVYPDSVAWQAGTRTVICEVRATSGELTGSVRGASATSVS